MISARWTVIVLERPGARDILGHRAGEHDADAMVVRRQIDFTRAVAIAVFHQPAGAIDAEALDHVACPAAAVGVDGKAALGTENAIVAPGGNVALKVALAAEQPEAVLDLPLDARLGGRALRERGRIRAVGQAGARSEQEKDAHGGGSNGGRMWQGIAQRVRRKCEARRVVTMRRVATSLAPQAVSANQWGRRFSRRHDAAEFIWIFGADVEMICFLSVSNCLI